MAEQQREPVTVLGLGPMGSALAGAFLDHAHPTTVWNRTATKVLPLAERGATAAASVEEAVTASDLVVVTVLDADAVHAIVEPVAEALRGRALVNLTADTPERARQTASWAQAHGIDYLDGSIMTPAALIGRPEAVLLYSGPEAVYAAHRETLSSLGGTATYLGAEVGRAAAYDVALLDVFWTAMTGVVHAFALAKAEHVPVGELAPFAQGILELAAELATEMAGEVTRGHHPADGSALASNVASMVHVIEVAEARGIDSSVLRAARDAGNRAIDAGYGADGFSRLTEVLATS